MRQLSTKHRTVQETKNHANNLENVKMVLNAVVQKLANVVIVTYSFFCNSFCFPLLFCVHVCFVLYLFIYCTSFSLLQQGQEHKELKQLTDNIKQICKKDSKAKLKDKFDVKHLMPRKYLKMTLFRFIAIVLSVSLNKDQAVGEAWYILSLI